MKKQWHYILMADIINSRNMKQAGLMVSFKELVAQANKERGDQLLSPLTITLGDEFQGVLPSLSAALGLIFFIEECIIASGRPFTLRYVLEEGIIDTPINPKRAYEMLGSGLTLAREALTALKEEKNRFDIRLEDKKKQAAINNSFVALQGITDEWKQKDYYILAAFLQQPDYKKVAADLKKERSLMWKRERSLKLKQYTALKKVVTYLGEK